MPTKKKSSSANSSSSKKKRSGKRKGTSSAGGKSTKSIKSRDASPEVIRREVTIFDTAAMDNLYYIAHNAADALDLRGFGPAGSKKGKKKKGKGKKKKKKKA